MYRRKLQKINFKRAKHVLSRIPQGNLMIFPIVGALGCTLYVMTDGAPPSLRLNAIFNRACLRDDPPAYLYKNLYWDWCGAHPPMTAQQMKSIYSALPKRIVAFDIWREDDSGVFRFHGGFWRKSHQELQHTWIEPSQSHQFTANVGLIGNLAASSSQWDFQTELSDNSNFLRAEVAKSANVSHGNGWSWRNHNRSYVIALYSSNASIGSNVIQPLEEITQENS